jgi:hypothetical protein
VVSFPRVSPSELYTRLSAPSSTLHAPTISFFSILSPAQYWARSTDYEALHYDVFFTPLLPWQKLHSTRIRLFVLANWT